MIGLVELRRRHVRVWPLPAPFVLVCEGTAVEPGEHLSPRVLRLDRVERPPTDPTKLLAYWMEWERGETPPGKVMSNLKTGGLRELLEALVAAAAEPSPG